MDQEWLFLKVENNTLITFPQYQHEHTEGYSYISFPAEQVNTFLEAHSIVPTYIDPNYVYGYYDNINKIWTGMMGHVCNIEISF